MDYANHFNVKQILSQFLIFGLGIGAQLSSIYLSFYRLEIYT